MADYNQAVVLDTIRHAAAGISRVELAAATGLTAQALSTTVRRLIKNGLIVEAGRMRTAGHPRAILNLNPEGQYAIGVHLDAAANTSVILNLAGDRVGCTRRTPMMRDPELVSSEIVEQTEDLIADSRIDRRKLVGVGIAAPGPIDAENGGFAQRPNLAGRPTPPLRTAVQAGLRLPVLIEREALAAAAAEKWLGAGGNLLYLYFGAELSAGLVLDNELFPGGSHNAGTIGNIVVDDHGAPCSCADRQPVGHGIPPQSQTRRADGTDARDDDAARADRQVMQALVRMAHAAAAGSPAAVETVDHAVRCILKTAEDIALLLDLDQIVFGGPHWSTLRPFFTDQRVTELQHRFGARNPHPLTVSDARIDKDAGAVGAASLVLDHTFSTNPMVLLSHQPTLRISDSRPPEPATGSAGAANGAAKPEPR